MKNLSAFLLYGFALLVLSCDNSKEESPEQWFRPTEVEVDGTSATATCLTLLGNGVLLSADCGFVCMPLPSTSDLPTVTVTEPEIDGSILRCRLTLAAETNYAIYPYVKIGTEHLTGDPTVFRTGKEPEKPDEPDPDEPDPDEPDPDNPDPDEPDPDDPDPDEPDPDKPTPPLPGGYPGWPELPKMEERPGDYYYATHICPTFTTASGVSETNLRSYTVCYSHEMMSGMWSAYPIHASYKGSTKRTDKWALDPIVPQSLQPYIVSASYKIPGSTSPYSRGHLLASNDRTASEGMNNQTFYVTNMAPQWQNGFNSGVWSSLEDKTWNNVCADTLFVVSGVYFANTDTTVKDNANPQNTVCVPTNFYKVMIRSKAGNTGKPLYELKADELQCIAFWFENKTYSGNSLTAYRTTVADIEQKTGMTFFPNVPDAPKESGAGNWSF